MSLHAISVFGMGRDATFQEISWERKNFRKNESVSLDKYDWSKRREKVWKKENES